MSLGRYTDDPYYFQPECVHCDDAGCPECCETQPITLDDLDDIAEQIPISEAPVEG